MQMFIACKNRMESQDGKTRGEREEAMRVHVVCTCAFVRVKCLQARMPLLHSKSASHQVITNCFIWFKVIA